MATETKEPENKGTELVDTSKGSEDKVSIPEAKVSEVKFTETPEFKAEVEKIAQRIAQSMKDKELKPLYEELSKAKKEASERTEALREHEEDREIDKQLGEAVEAGELTEANKKTLQSFRDDLRKKAKFHNAEVEKLRKEREGVEEERKSVGELKLERQVNSVFRIAEEQGVSLKYSEAETIAKESEGNKKLIELWVKTKSVTEPPKRPDGGESGGGGDSEDALLEKAGAGQPLSPDESKRLKSIVSKLKQGG